jgi:hypothetical protein
MKPFAPHILFILIIATAGLLADKEYSYDTVSILIAAGVAVGLAISVLTLGAFFSSQQEKCSKALLTATMGDSNGSSTQPHREQFELWIEYPNGEIDTLLVSSARRERENAAFPAPTANIYRIEETPAFGFADPDLDLSLRDIIETELKADGTHRFVRVVKRAELRHYSWILPQRFADSRQCSEYVAEVEAAGGIWERIMGGLLLVHIPPGSKFDAEAELNRFMRAAMDGASRA